VYNVFVLVTFLLLFLATCARLSLPHSVSESALNSSIVSYRIDCMTVG